MVYLGLIAHYRAFVDLYLKVVYYIFSTQKLVVVLVIETIKQKILSN
jgi:hypothetical protein